MIKVDNAMGEDLRGKESSFGQIGRNDSAASLPYSFLLIFTAQLLVTAPWVNGGLNQNQELKSLVEMVDSKQIISNFL